MFFKAMVLAAGVALLLTAAAGSALAERRVALVMGNSAYLNTVKLPNPRRDAEAMSDLLKAMGFEVVLGTDLDRDQMVETLSEFSRKSGGAEVALFFYAGHGMQLDGQNYLLPVDANLRSEFDVKARAIDMGSVLQATMTDAKVKLVMLDACRDNPFAAQLQAAAPKTRSVLIGSGLAEMRPGEGTLITFATGPGQVAIDGEGSHSPFTRALLTHLPVPDVEIRHALTRVRAQVAEDTHKQQTPWENTNLTGFFYMKNAEPVVSTDVQASLAPATQLAPSSPLQGLDPRVLEIELWNSVKASQSESEYRAYLDKFPTGLFADVARTRIAALSSKGQGTALAANAAPVAVAPSAATDSEVKAAEATSATEDALGLDKQQWQLIQKQLSGLGFGTRGTDGRVGDGTRRGLAAWQASRQYPATGYLNRLQRDALMGQQLPATADTAVSAPRTRGYSRSDSNGSSGQRQRSSRRDGDAAGAAAVGAFVGGVARGFVGRRIGF